MFYVYILQSLKNSSYYIGYTEDLNERLVMHNAGRVKGTKYRRPFIIVYTEIYSTATEARKREYYIKRQKSRKFIEDLINKN